ncbi:MAG: cytochrome b562 [Phycisphaerales bacterium]
MRSNAVRLVGLGIIGTMVVLGSLTPASGLQPPAQRGEQPRERGNRQPGERGGERGQQSVEGAMKVIDRSLKNLQGQLDDASKKDDNLRQVGEAQRAAVTAKLLRPGKQLDKAKDEGERKKMEAQYRRGLMDVVRKLLDMEQAIVDDKADDAKRLLAEIVKMRDDAHKAMGVDE